MNDKGRKYLPSGIAVLCVIATALITAVVFHNFGGISAFISKLNQILTPIALGAVFAFLLTPVYNRLVKKKVNKYVAELICLVILLTAIFLLAMLIIPKFISSVSTVVSNLSGSEKSISEIVTSLFSGRPEIAERINAVLLGISDSLASWVRESLLPNLGKYVTTVSSGVYNVLSALFKGVIGIIVMLYLLNIKDVLAAQLKKICYALFTVEKANSIIARCNYIRQVFMGFILGKAIDSLIIGLLTFLIISLFNMPYKALIATIVGVTNIIPFFGPFIGAIPCALLLLLISPRSCFFFILIILAIQQLDGNVIGPKILGSVTKISSFWVLFSILFFGGLFGVVGMIIAVPTFAVLYAIIRDHVDETLEKKKLPTAVWQYKDLEKITLKDSGYERKIYEKKTAEPWIMFSGKKNRNAGAFGGEKTMITDDPGHSKSGVPETDKNRKEE